MTGPPAPRPPLGPPPPDPARSDGPVCVPAAPSRPDRRTDVEPSRSGPTSAPRFWRRHCQFNRGRRRPFAVERPSDVDCRKSTARAGDLARDGLGGPPQAEKFAGSDWQSGRKRDDLEVSEPVPANWFRRAVFGIRRPTRSREGTLRGAFAAVRRRPLSGTPDNTRGHRRGPVSGRPTVPPHRRPCRRSAAAEGEGESGQTTVGAVEGAFDGEQLTGGLLVLHGVGGIGVDRDPPAQFIQCGGERGEFCGAGGHRPIMAPPAPTVTSPPTERGSGTHGPGGRTRLVR